MNEGFGKEFNREGNSVKGSRPFNKLLDSEEGSFLRSSPSRNSALMVSLSGKERRPEEHREEQVRVEDSCTGALILTQSLLQSFQGV